jgi:hypothetical protein
MCCQNTRGRWRQCPGCGRERRLASGRAVMCGHNRWDSATWSMVPCEGSGQPPHRSRLRAALARKPGLAGFANGRRQGRVMALLRPWRRRRTRVASQITHRHGTRRRLLASVHDEQGHLASNTSPRQASGCGKGAVSSRALAGPGGTARRAG